MSNIPMTRMEEALAIHDKGVGYPSSFVELQGERILMFGMGEFRTSTDGGITWSEPFQAKDDKGEVFLPGGGSLVNLSGGAIGLSTRRQPKCRGDLGAFPKCRIPARGNLRRTRTDSPRRTGRKAIGPSRCRTGERRGIRRSSARGIRQVVLSCGPRNEGSCLNLPYLLGS